MEALLSLILGPPLGFRFDLIPRATCGPSVVSSSLKCRGGALRDIPCFDCGVLFCSVVWLGIKSIVKLIMFLF